MTHQQKIFQFIQKTFPQSFVEIGQKNLISDNLFSPFHLELPQSVFDKAQSFISAIYEIKESEAYLSRWQEIKDWPLTPSLLTCFDFHYSPEMGLKIIEINTNASLYLPSILQSCALLNQCMDAEFDNLHQSFIDSFNLKAGDEISIFDENPEEEGLYFEFLIFKEWLTKKGYKVNIVSLKDFTKQAKDKIYNRYTDFYFKEEKSSQLLDYYLSGQKLFSPNPRGYFLLADKRRLSTYKEILEEQGSNELSQVIPESKLFAEFTSKEELWSLRKKYFLKPSSSFGSKAVFNGKGISRKAFDDIYHPDFMAQELCPAGKEVFNFNGESIEMKFDLRFFTFNGQIQNYTARLYQGQATNLRTKWGGIAPIRFI